MALADHARWQPVGGGSICRVWHAATADGQPVIVKDAPYDVAVDAEGLAALRRAGAPVVHVAHLGAGWPGAVRQRLDQLGW